MQSQNPRTFAQLSQLLDERNQQHHILPNPHMKGFRFNVEARKLEEAERLALIVKTHERFAGEY